MSGSIYYVDLNAVIVCGGILRKDRDSTLSFECVAVHYSVFNFLIVTEYTALLQHFIDQCRLAVVNVCDDRYIP